MTKSLFRTNILRLVCALERPLRNHARQLVENQNPVRRPWFGKGKGFHSSSWLRLVDIVGSFAIRAHAMRYFSCSFCAECSASTDKSLANQTEPGKYMKIEQARNTNVKRNWRFLIDRWLSNAWKRTMLQIKLVKSRASWKTCLHDCASNQLCKCKGNISSTHLLQPTSGSGVCQRRSWGMSGCNTSLYCARHLYTSLVLWFLDPWRAQLITFILSILISYVVFFSFFLGLCHCSPWTFLK